MNLFSKRKPRLSFLVVLLATTLVPYTTVNCASGGGLLGGGKKGGSGLDAIVAAGILAALLGMKHKSGSSGPRYAPPPVRPPGGVKHAQPSMLHPVFRNPLMMPSFPHPMFIHHPSWDPRLAAMDSMRHPITKFNPLEQLLSLETFGQVGPVVSLNSPHIGLNSPHIALNSPHIGLNSPLVGLNSPHLALSSPTLSHTAMLGGTDQRMPTSGSLHSVPGYDYLSQAGPGLASPNIPFHKPGIVLLPQFRPGGRGRELSLPNIHLHNKQPLGHLTQARHPHIQGLAPPHIPFVVKPFTISPVTQISPVDGRGVLLSSHIPLHPKQSLEHLQGIRQVQGPGFLNVPFHGKQSLEHLPGIRQLEGRGLFSPNIPFHTTPALEHSSGFQQIEGSGHFRPNIPFNVKPSMQQLLGTRPVEGSGFLSPNVPFHAKQSLQHLPGIRSMGGSGLLTPNIPFHARQTFGHLPRITQIGDSGHISPNLHFSGRPPMENLSEMRQTDNSERFRSNVPFRALPSGEDSSQMSPRENDDDDRVDTEIHIIPE